LIYSQKEIFVGIGRIGQDFIVNSTVTDSQFNPSITALADGRFVATWHSNDSSDGSGTNIRARIYNVDGSAAGGDFIVNSTTVSNQTDPSTTALADGSFVVSWTSADPGDGSSTCIRARVYDADSSPAGDDFIVNSTAEDFQSTSSITALADGRFVAAWTSFDTGDGPGDGLIRARVYNADGSASGDDFIVNSPVSNSQLEPSVTALADGRFVVTWYSYDPGDGSGTNIRAQIFDPTMFIGTAGEDIWQGGSLNDRITGGGSADTLSGLGGDDLINGDAGDDILNGGDGNDRLLGGAGNDTLNSGSGNDTMAGGTGDDIYVVTDAGDTTLETAGQGTDTVRSYIDWALANNVEGLELLGSATSGAGNALDNTLVGNSLNNVLNGGAGNDNMAGGTGNDTYIVAAAGDVTTENAGEGTDTVRSYVNWTLANNVERLELRGASNLNGTGNALANTLVGNSGANSLSGGDGNDYIVGGVGNDTLNGGNQNDTLNGGDQNDTLVGGAGADAMNGGAGNDSFLYQLLTDTGVGPGNRDTINGFVHGQDLINLAALDANAGVSGNQAFSFIGSAAFSGVAGQLRYSVFGNVCLVDGDVNGDSVADFQIAVAGTNFMTGTDFLV
jgi:Ca2+-binding RTX toxin-like protein